MAFGFGDVNLSGVLGLMLGWPFIVVGLVIAVLIGGVISLIYILGMLVTTQISCLRCTPIRSLPGYRCNDIDLFLGFDRSSRWGIISSSAIEYSIQGFQ